MKVLVTGASGTIGYHVIPKLLEKNHEVTVIKLNNKKNLKRLKPYMDKINIVWGSIVDKELVKEIMKNQDVVIHLAGLIPPFTDKNPELTKQVNYDGTENTIEAIKESKKDIFLMFASSIAVYGDRLDKYNIKVTDELKIKKNDYYPIIKKQTEDLIIRSGINYTIFRLTAIMDVPKVDPLMFHMPLDTRMEIASANDTAKAFVNGIDHIKELNGKIYNLGGGEECRIVYRDFLKNCLDIYGLNYKYLDEKAFAEKNFHCGYYEDGNILNDIVNFREDTLETYYKYLRENVSNTKRIITKMFSYYIIYILNQRSEPYKARKTKNKSLIQRFFK